MREYKFNEADKILRKNDFVKVGTSGGGSSHIKYRHKGDGRLVVINRKLQAPVFQRIVKENSLIL